MEQRQATTLIQADIPVHFWGAPGCGKTEWQQGIARALGMVSHVEILSQCDPTDFGIPREKDGKIVRMPLQWIVEACERPTIIFLDEFSLAPRSVLAATLTFVQSRRIADRTLHPGTRIMLASNGPEFTGTDLLPQQANRMAHIDFEDMVPLTDWTRGMISGFPSPVISSLPPTWTAHIPKHRALVASFVSKLPSEAFRIPKDAAGMGRAWPSRRTWDLAARASAACEAARVDDALPIGSLVGDGQALPYIGWRARQDLPDLEDVLERAESYPLPEEDDRLFVILSGIAGIIVATPNPARWERGWILCGRAAKMGRADVATVAARVLAEQPPKGAKAPKIAEELIPILRAAGGA